MNAYFDTSALVKLVIEEDGSAVALGVWNGCDTAITSRLAYPEARAALAAARRDRRISRQLHEQGRTALLDRLADMRIVELTREVALLAGELAESARLRGPDAVHLASAVAVGEVVLTTWDLEQRRAASELGLAVAGV